MSSGTNAKSLEIALRAKSKASIEVATLLSQGPASGADAGMSRAFYAVLQGLAVVFLRENSLGLQNLVNKGIFRRDYGLGFEHRGIMENLKDVLRDPKQVKLVQTLRGQRTAADYKGARLGLSDLNAALLEAETLLQNMKVLP